ncbi:MAG: hypothetical protein HOC20_10375, partial [Chloroflexi bacterium]|nr:hypothetical protein [Chloroflexota bacterium]
GDRPYSLKLVLSSGDKSAVGDSFDIYVQGEKLLENVVVPPSSEGARARTLIAGVERVMADRELKLKIVPSQGNTNSGATVCGLKIAAL